LITDSAGVQKYAYDYYAFGKDAAFNTGDPEALHFTGHERDYESGTAVPNTDYLDYMHARYYSSNLGRFLSVDPKAHARQAMHSPQMWNRYAYAIDNPIAYTDPTGESVYLVTYTTGNPNSDEELRRTAYTRANALRHQKGFDRKHDKVLVRGVGSVADFNKAVQAANGLQKTFGGVKELSLFSHAGRHDGPIFHQGGGEQNFNWNALGSLDMNWEAGATARFYGCNTSKCGFTQAFANAQGVLTFGFGHSVYFSSDPTQRAGVPEGGPLYMIDALGMNDLPVLGGLAAMFGHPSARPMVEADPNH
jgi:RHS repeat-associated protein